MHSFIVMESSIVSAAKCRLFKAERCSLALQANFMLGLPLLSFNNATFSKPSQWAPFNNTAIFIALPFSNICTFMRSDISILTSGTAHPASFANDEKTLEDFTSDIPFEKCSTVFDFVNHSDLDLLILDAIGVPHAVSGASGLDRFCSV